MYKDTTLGSGHCRQKEESLCNKVKAVTFKYRFFFVKEAVLSKKNWETFPNFNQVHLYTLSVDDVRIHLENGCFYSSRGRQNGQANVDSITALRIKNCDLFLSSLLDLKQEKGLI